MLARRFRPGACAELLCKRLRRKRGKAVRLMTVNPNRISVAGRILPIVLRRDSKWQNEVGRYKPVI